MENLDRAVPALHGTLNEGYSDGYLAPAGHGQNEEDIYNIIQENRDNVDYERLRSEQDVQNLTNYTSINSNYVYKPNTGTLESQPVGQVIVNQEPHKKRGWRWCIMLAVFALVTLVLVTAGIVITMFLTGYFKDKTENSDQVAALNDQTSTTPEVKTSIPDCSDKPGEDTTMHLTLDGRTKTVRCIDGWTIVTLRKDGSQNFNQSWIAYKEGFGDVNSEHYIGNDFLYKLSNQESPYVIRIDMTDYNDLSLYAQYDLFYIGSEEMKYLLHLGEYSGTAGDSLTYEGLVKYVPFVATFANEVYHNHMRFSTFDEDNDKSYGGNCAVTWESGFWFNKCFSSNLHGVYENSTRCTTKAKCMFWASWPGMNPITYYNMNTLKTVIIKMKPRDKL